MFNWKLSSVFNTEWKIFPSIVCKSSSLPAASDDDDKDDDVF